MPNPLPQDAAPAPLPLDCAATAIRGPRPWEPAALLGIAVEFVAGLVALVGFLALVSP